MVSPKGRRPRPKARSRNRSLPADFILRAYRDARAKASDEADLPIATFPEAPSSEFERALSAPLDGDDFGF